jgi:hypothetical protein
MNMPVTCPSMPLVRCERRLLLMADCFCRDPDRRGSCCLVTFVQQES